MGLAGWENMLLAAGLYLLPPGEQKGALSTMEPVGSTDQFVEPHSGRMVRRLPNRPGMMHRSFVLFMDRPTVDLDPQAPKTLWDHMSATPPMLSCRFIDEIEELLRPRDLHDPGHDFGASYTLTQRPGSLGLVIDIVVLATLLRCR